jgi:Delta3-Delta2-enoyl-CoA isomerase
MHTHKRCQAISRGIQEIEARENSAEVMILQSSTPVFCAGLDLNELYQPRRLEEFWTSFQQLYLDLFGTRLATIAAISGQAPAAGCMLAMAADYRIIQQPSTDSPRSNSVSIGLNEAKFGIVAPSWMADLMVHTIGQRQAELSLMLGTLYSPKEALTIGLVDKVMDDDDDMAKACQKVAMQWAKVPSHSRIASKRLMRQPLLEKLKSSRQQDLDLFCQFCRSEQVQANLGMYLQSLKKKSE